MSSPSAYTGIRGSTALPDGSGRSCGGRCAGKRGAGMGKTASAVPHVCLVGDRQKGVRCGETLAGGDKALCPTPAPCFLKG